MRLPIQAQVLAAAVALSAMAASPAPAIAQDHDHAAGMDRLGTVVFPVSCAPEAQRRFAQAMAVLHSFWWEEGDRAFDAVLAADSACAMAWWGKAMNAWNNPFAGGPAGAALTRGATAAARAAALGAPTTRERGFLAAAAALYRDAGSTSNASRLQAYADTMSRLHRDFPDDVEIAIYHALALVATAPRTDTTFARQKQAAAILNPLFAAHPDHPGLAHYIIHSNDAPALAHLGLDAARRYAEIAPAAPHAQHMPSHIFVRLGLWDETVSANWRSYQAGVDYARALGRAEVAPHEFHALDYAVYGDLQRGRDSAALATVALAHGIATSGTVNTLLGGYNGTAMQARIPLERSDWTAAAAFPVYAAPDVPLVTALARFTRGIGAARSGSLAQARAEVAALDSIAGLLAARDAYWARVVGIKRDAVRAWVLLAEGDTAGAVALARAAADHEDVTDKHPVTPAELLPARELEADMLLAVGRHEEARAAYQATLAREPGRARSTFGAARAAELAGDHPRATIGYRAYLELMEGGDGKRAELETARAYLAQAAASRG
jgi:tetratricopeptide (TPR) repeat protein